MARAATSGRRIVFYFTGLEPISGYLVGSDDYRWLVAVQVGQSLQISLIHKGSNPLLTIGPVPTLQDEDQALQDFVERIGRGFFDFCDETYFGKAKQPVAAVPTPFTPTRQENVS